MAKSFELISKIPGWGADLAPENRPGVPREKAPPGGTGAHWSEPERQRPTVKIHVSVERPAITPVFGSACPPKGLSGKLRDFGYRFGEARLARWLVLLLADRVDMLESAAGELLRGRPDNPFTEMGLGAEFRKGGRLSTLKGRSAIIAATASTAALGFGLARYYRSQQDRDKAAQGLQRAA